MGFVTNAAPALDANALPRSAALPGPASAGHAPSGHATSDPTPSGPAMSGPAMSGPAPHSGASMDRRVAKRRLRWPGGPRANALLAVAALATAAALAWQRAPRVQAASTTAQVATVQAGTFHDDVVLRARAEPLRSVQLDAPEAGRVEAVLAQDGDVVAAGAPLYRLQSDEQEQLLMQRGSEVAQQMANVSMERSAQAQSLAQNRRELAQLQAAQGQAESDWQRQSLLADAGFVSPAALAQAVRQRALATQLLADAREDQRREAAIRAQSIDQMTRAVQGLQLLELARERLQPRAPMAGRLSGFALQVGAAVRPGDHLGRIDDPAGGVQLVADVDEYWLPRLRAGNAGLVATSAAGDLRLAQVLPQVHDGKVRVLLRWRGDTGSGPSPGAMQPGQALDVRLQLSPPTPALLLPEGPGVQSSLYVRERGGAGDGRTLQRRYVTLGRRAAGQVEVLAGLQAGDEVLVSQPPGDGDTLALP